MCSCDQLRKLVAQVRPVGRMSLEPCISYFIRLVRILNLFNILLLTVGKVSQRKINKYTQHLSFKIMGYAPIPNLPKCVYVRANHSWSSFTYRRSEYKGFLSIFANRLS